MTIRNVGGGPSYPGGPGNVGGPNNQNPASSAQFAGAPQIQNGPANGDAFQLSGLPGAPAAAPVNFRGDTLAAVNKASGLSLEQAKSLQAPSTNFGLSLF